MTEFTPKEMSALEIVEEISRLKEQNKEKIKKREQYRNNMGYYEGLMKNEDCAILDNIHSINTLLDMWALQVGQGGEK